MIYVWNRYICPRHTWVNIIIFQCRDKYRTTIEERQAQYDTDNHRSHGLSRFNLGEVIKPFMVISSRL